MGEKPEPEADARKKAENKDDMPDLDPQYLRALETLLAIEKHGPEAFAAANVTKATAPSPGPAPQPPQEASSSKGKAESFSPRSDSGERQGGQAASSSGLERVESKVSEDYEEE